MNEWRLMSDKPDKSGKYLVCGEYIHWCMENRCDSYCIYFFDIDAIYGWNQYISNDEDFREMYWCELPPLPCEKPN